MLPFLQNLFGGGAAAAGAVAPTVDPQIMFDPTLGKVVPGSLTPGMPQAGGPPMPMPKPDMPYGGPDMPPMARGTPSGPAPSVPPGAGLSAGSWTGAMKDQPPMPQPNPGQPGAGLSASSWAEAMRGVPQEEPAYGGPDMPPMARAPQSSGNPLIDFIRYKTGGSF